MHLSKQWNCWSLRCSWSITCRPQMGPMLAPWTLLSGKYIHFIFDESPTVQICFVFFVWLCYQLFMDSCHLLTHIHQGSLHRYGVDWAHDDIIKWKHFLRYWPFVRGIHRSPVNSPHKGQWCRALMFFFICTWINGWLYNGEAGDLRCHSAHYDVAEMNCTDISWHIATETK